MSDNEGTTKKSGYRLEYASSARSKCKGPKPCAGSPIAKGELRVGSVVDFRGNTSYAWRHWGCTTAKIISNMKSQFESADELDGFDDLKDEDKERLRKAWEEGKVADEDIPETARKAPGEEAEDDEEKPKKRAPAKAKKDASGEDGEKPKRKRAPAKAKKAEDEGDEDAEDKPKKAPARKPRAKVRCFQDSTS
ncbi:zf-PARP-domain-containing protein [Suillus decipiens]|nr:zf-PARP-domain-containing protein [Suillus decipiens]